MNIPIIRHDRSAHVPVDDCRPPSVNDVVGLFTLDGWNQYRRYIMCPSRVEGCANYSVKYAQELLEMCRTISQQHRSRTVDDHLCAIARHRLHSEREYDRCS
jgi:hypothetical protein